MTDLSYPTNTAVDIVGVLDKYDEGHEPGWAMSVIEDIQEQKSKAWNGWFDRKWYDAEELAVWDHYVKVTQDDEWKKIVAEHQKNTKEVEYGSFGDKDYSDKPASTFKQPEKIKEYGGKDNPNGDLVVSTEAIEHFCKQIEIVAPKGVNGPIWKVIKELDAIDMRPGSFGYGIKLRNDVQGSSSGTASSAGLAGETRGALAKIHEAFHDLQVSLRAMVKEYETAEEFNGLTSEQLNSVLSEFARDVDKIGDYGSADTSTNRGARDEAGDG